MALIHKTFSVTNIQIRTSADTIERRVSVLNGVCNVSVSHSSGTMDVDYDPDLITSDQIRDAVKECGYTAYTQEMPVLHEEIQPAREWRILPPLAGSLLTLLAALLKAPFILCLIPAGTVFWYTRDIYSHCQKSFKERTVDTRVLTGSAALLAMFLAVFSYAFGRNGGYFVFDACSLLTALKGREIVLEHSRETFSRPLDEVKKQFPATASVYEKHTEHQTSIDELHRDSVIIVRPGEIIPIDGTVIRGFAEVEESALTGSDLPVEKNEGSYVYASSRCLKGSVEISAERVGTDTAMMQFARLAEKTAEEGTYRTPFQDFEKYIVLFALACALLGFAGWMFSGRDFFFCANVVLTVLCCIAPESIALSKGNAVLNAAKLAAMRHVLFRNTDALELVGRCDHVILEQDGALTENEYTVTDFIRSGKISPSRFEYIVYALESRNNKPFAKAITHYMKSRRISEINAEEFAMLGIHGRRAVRTMSHFTSGTASELISQGVDLTEWKEQIRDLTAEGKRVQIYAEDLSVIGLIAAEKRCIPESEEAVNQLREMDISPVLITNGTPESSKILSEKFHIRNVLHNPQAEETEEYLNSLRSQETAVAYVSGRDMSDVPADLKVAIGTGARTDDASSDILLTGNRLKDFVYAIRLSDVLNEKIQQMQGYLILYHVLITLLFSFVLPAVIPLSIPPVLASACSVGVLYLILRFSVQIDTKE